MLAHLGVTVFFVISGLLITTLLIREYEVFGKINLRTFFRRRILRIMPAAFFFIFVIIVLGHPTVKQILLALTFTTSFDFKAAYKPLQHLWSLSVEEQFYLVLPLLFMGGIQRARSWCWAAVVIAPIIRLVFARHDVFHKFPGVADSLAYGCLVAFYYGDIKEFVMKNFSSTLALTALCVLTVIFGWIGFEYFPVAWGLVPALVSVMTLALIERADPLLNFSPIAWVGTLSYSIYLWQQPFLILDGMLDIFPLRLLCAFVCAVASYYLIEKPALHYFKPRPQLLPAANEGE